MQKVIHWHTVSCEAWFKWSFGVVGFDGWLIFPPETNVIVWGGDVFFAAVESSTERDIHRLLLVAGTGTTTVGALVAPDFAWALDFLGSKEENGKLAGVLQVVTVVTIIIEGESKLEMAEECHCINHGYCSCQIKHNKHNIKLMNS